MSIEENWAHYRSAVVEIYGSDGPFVVGPHSVLGKRDVTPPDGDLDCWIITAENPDGNDAPLAENARAAAALGRDLDRPGWTVLHAVGGDLSWTHTERSFVVTGPTEAQALALGRKYGQHAIFGWNRDRWALISCVDDRREEMPWGSVRCPATELAGREDPGPGS